MTPLEAPAALARDAAWLVGLAAEAVAPPPERTLSQWAEETLVIPGEAGTARPGRLSWEGYEYLREPLDRLHPDDPCRSVTVRASAQLGKTTIGVAACCYYSAVTPRPWAVALPSLDEVHKYNREKFSPIVDATPLMRRTIRAVSSRDEQGSTTTFKRFSGGKGAFIPASTPKALQMVSVAILVLEETPNYEDAVGDRGAPIPQLRRRQMAWETAGAKELHVATPGISGRCPVTTDFLAGDQRRLYHPCPHCGDYLRLDWADMRGLKPAPDAPPGTRPRPHFLCPHCHERIEHRHKADLVAACVWVPTFQSLNPGNPAPPAAFPAAELARWRDRPCEGRQPSYHAWQVVSPMATWALIADEFDRAERAGEAERMAFAQQILGEAYEIRAGGADLPDIAAKARPAPAGIVPDWAEILTASVDLNGDFAAWRVYAWGPNFEHMPIDGGRILRRPSDPELWAELAQMAARRYPHAGGGSVAATWGVDSGYSTATVYAFCGRNAHVRALDGRQGFGQPPIRRVEKPAKIRGPDGVVVACRIWAVGTWDLKRRLYECLAVTAEGADRGPNLLHLPDWFAPQASNGERDLRLLEELTAEHLIETVNATTGELRPERWQKLRRRNEEMDLWVYCAALAMGFGVGLPNREPDWLALRARRLEGAQGDLLAPPQPVASASNPAEEAQRLEEIYARLAAAEENPS